MEEHGPKAQPRAMARRLLEDLTASELSGPNGLGGPRVLLTWALID